MAKTTLTHLLSSKTMKKYSKLTSVIVLTVIISIIGAVTNSSKTIAEIQPSETETAIEEAALPAGKGNSISAFFQDLVGFIENDAFGAINDILQSALGAIKLPDLYQINNDVMGTETSSNDAMKLSEELETNSSTQGKGSYAIRVDYNKQAQRNAAVGSAQGETLSETAQTKSKQNLEAIASNTQDNEDLGQDSEASDVTQHIMQNVSSQLALQAQVDNKLYIEAQQARSDRALANVISAQTADEVAGTNLADRRSSAAASNIAVQQEALMMLPGGGTLDPN